MKIVDLNKILKGDIGRINQVNVSDVALYEDNVPVYPEDVERMLKKYLLGKLTVSELSQWAEFLTLRGEYDCPPQKVGDDEDFYEQMWDVVHALSVPEIDGAITPERVKGYLTELRKYRF